MEMDVGTLSLDDIIQKKGKGSKFGNRQRRDGGIQKPKGKPRAWDNDKISQNRGDGQRRNSGGARGSRSLSGGGKAIARLSNLPFNVSQEDLNDLFGEHRLARIALHYDFRGKSLGTAELHGASNVISRLAREFTNVEIDGRPLSIQVVGGSSDGGIQTRIRRTSSGRGGNTRQAGNRPAGNRRSGPSGKSREPRKPKLTAEQLDAELESYMAGSAKE